MTSLLSFLVIFNVLQFYFLPESTTHGIAAQFHFYRKENLYRYHAKIEMMYVES